MTYNSGKEIKQINIFDCNGFIFDSYFRYKLLERFLSEMSLSPDFQDVQEDLKRYSEKISSATKLVEDSIPRGEMSRIFSSTLAGEPNKDEIWNRLRGILKEKVLTDEYQKIAIENTRVIPGSVEVIKCCKGLEDKNVVVSNQDHLTLHNQMQNIKIEGVRLADFFDGYQGNTGVKNEGRYDTPKKPSPIVSQKLLQELGANEQTQILIFDDGLKNILLRRDGNESRPEDFAKALKARLGYEDDPQEAGIQIGRNVRFILINPEVDISVLKAATTPSEFIEISPLLKQGGGFAENIGWYPDALMLAKNIVPIKERISTSALLNDAYLDAVKEKHDGDIPIHLYPDYTIFPGEEDWVFVEKTIESTAELNRFGGLSTRSIATYRPEQIAYFYTAAFSQLMVVSDSPEEYVEQVVNTYNEYIVKDIQEIGGPLLEERNRNIFLAYDILSLQKSGKSTDIYPEELVDRVNEISKLLEQRGLEGKYKSSEYAGNEIFEQSDKIIAHRVANSIYKEKAREQIGNFVKNKIDEVFEDCDKTKLVNVLESISCIITGANGNGKTTCEAFVREILENNGLEWKDLVKLDYDHLGSALMYFYKDGLKNPDSYAKVKKTLNSEFFSELLNDVVLGRLENDLEKVYNVILNNLHLDQNRIDALLEGGSELKIVTMTVAPEESLVRVYKRGLDNNHFESSRTAYKNNRDNTISVFKAIENNPGKKITLEIANNEVPFGERPNPVAYVDMQKREILIFDMVEFENYFKKTLMKPHDTAKGEIDFIDKYLKNMGKRAKASHLKDYPGGIDLIYSKVIDQPNVYSKIFAKLMMSLSQEYTIHVLDKDIKDGKANVSASIQNGAVKSFMKSQDLEELKRKPEGFYIGKLMQNGFKRGQKPDVNIVVDTSKMISENSNRVSK